MGTEPFLDEVLGVSAKAKHEVPLGLQLVDGLNSLMDLEKRCKCQIVLQPWRPLLDLGPEVPVLISSPSLWPQRLWRQRTNLDVKRGNLLLVGGGGQKVAHLGLQWVIHLHINVVAGCLLLVIRIHAAGSKGKEMETWPCTCQPPSLSKV